MVERAPRGTSRGLSEGRAVRAAILLVALLITAVAYHSALPGGFVYDDRVQIVENPFVTDGRLFGEALLSDVWGFKGESREAWSNYWRPTFVLWLIANYRLFGFEPAGWHAGGLLLHCVVIVLCAAVLRRLRVPAAVSAATLWVFAAHPVHVESVSWLSGSPDLLLATFLLGSYVAWLARRSGTRRGWSAVGLALFAAATLSKEVSAVFPLLIGVSEWSLDDRGKSRPARERLRSALLSALPYLLVAAIAQVARLLVLGSVLRPSETTAGVGAVLLGLPSFFAFYLRQVFWPTALSPVHPLRPLGPDELDLVSFLLPLAVLVGFVAVAVALWRRGGVYRIGLSVYLLFLAPAMNVGAFSPERMAQDRYLYLALLGILLVAFSAFAELFGRLSSPKAADGALYVSGLLFGVVLSATTIEYNRAWSSEVALWEHAVGVYPGSVMALGNLGYHYREAGRIPEATAVLERALSLDPDDAQVRVDLGIIAMGQGRLDDAEASFRGALARDPNREAALERLALIHIERGRLDEAIGIFEEARRRFPYRAVRNTLNIAVLQERLGRDASALAELESILPALSGRSDPDSMRGYFQLGGLYDKAGRLEEARAAYRTYLERTEGVVDPRVEGLRQVARSRLDER